MNRFIGVLLQLHTWNNVFNTSAIQLPSEFSSTDCLSHYPSTAKILYALGNTMSLEESIASRIVILADSDYYVTTDGQSASRSGNKAPIWGLRPDLYYCQTVAGLLMWGSLSNERTGLSFARVTPSSNKSLVSIQHIEGLCQSRISTADRALSLVAPATTAL
jgi:hypothetical protein